jgi:SRSO17 transposase
MEFCATYGKHFVVHGKDVGGHAQDYARGLLSKSSRKSIGRIGEAVPESNYQGMQQFISDSPWKVGPVMEQVHRDAEGILGGHPDTALYLDESGFGKKGKMSVGVSRQYCGRLGKVDNCQMGVFACLGRGERSALVNFRLFLPQEWVEDEERCRKARVPESERRYRTKPQLALEMVEQLRAQGSSHQWVGGDAIYGNSPELTRTLDDMGETFLMDVSSNHPVWTSDPCLSKDGSGSRRSGKAKEKHHAGAEKLPAARLAEQFFQAHSRAVIARPTTQGPLRVRIWARQVWDWDGTSDTARPRVLVVRQEQDGSFKYSLSNISAQTSWERLAYMQGQRYWIERSFQDAKSELGMADYEVRSWTGWHHHIAMVCMAMLFTVKTRIAHTQTVPLLSVRDIVDLLDYFIPRPKPQLQNVIEAMQERHRLRRKASKSAAKRRKRLRKI